MRLLLLALPAATTLAAPFTGYPDELFDEAQIQALIDQGTDAAGNTAMAGNLGGGLHFNMPAAFSELDSFLETREHIQQGTRAHASVSPLDVGRVDFKDEPPILCETICRPVNDTEMTSARKEAGEAEANVQNAGAAKDANAAALASGLSFMELESKICAAKGGGWVDGVEGDGDGKGKCEPYMVASEATTTYHPDAIFQVCRAEFGARYLPCSPYQALALSNLYDIPDTTHFRLWPGGRPDQVTNAAMKQQIGNNPSTGLDTCPDQQHVGFFHNWDESHVDSWGCLHDELPMQVLCCRRGMDKKTKKPVGQ